MPPSELKTTPAQAESLSATLGQVGSVEARMEAWERHLDEHSAEFERDCDAVSRLLAEQDLQGLIEHGSRYAHERAEARAVAIRCRD